MKRSRSWNRKVNILTTLLSQLVTMICGIIVPKLMLSAFGSSIYGLIVSITQFLSYISLLESGIGGVARAELYRPLAAKDTSAISAIYKAVKKFYLWIGAAFVGYSIVLGLCYKSLAHITLYSETFIFVLVFVIGISTLAKYAGGLANLTLICADQKQYVNNAIMTITTIANTIAIYITIKAGYNIVAVKLISSMIFVVRPIMYTLYVHKHYTIEKDSSKQAVLHQKRTGIGQHIAYFLHTNTDIALLTLFADIRLVAVYSIYNMVVSNIRSIVTALSGGMEAAFGEMYAKGEDELLRHSYAKYQRLITVASLVLFSCAGILIVPFVRLYTSGITDANYIQPVFSMILLMAETINCLMLPSSSLPIATNRLKETRVGAYGEATINIVLSLVLINWNPLLGVAIGTVTATLFKSLYYTIDAEKNVFYRKPGKSIANMIKTYAILLAMIVCGRVLLRYVEITNYYVWFVCGVITFAAAAAVAFLFMHPNATEHKFSKTA